MKKMISSAVLGVISILTLLIFSAYLMLSQEFAKLENDDPKVWEPVIQKFEYEDKIKPVESEAVLFIGSSSIRFWKSLEEDFKPIPVIKRGFGGAKISDIIYYADRIIVPYKPKAIVLFAGTNDISGRPNDKTAEQVYLEFKKLAKYIKIKLPDTKLFYLPITPTTSRWDIWPEASKVNRLIAQYISSEESFTYINSSKVFLNEKGMPRKELLWLDGVHLNKKGYKQWRNLLIHELSSLYK